MADANQGLLSALLPYATAQQGPAIQRSQYLADYLSQMRETGAQQSKTPVALGANLLATALLGHGQRNAFKDLYGGLQNNFRQSLDMSAAGIPGLDASIKPAAAPQAPPAVSAAPSAMPPGAQTLMQPGPIQDQQGAMPMPAAAPAQQAQQAPPNVGVPNEVLAPLIGRAKMLIESGIPANMQEGRALIEKIQALRLTPTALGPGFKYNADGSTTDIQHHSTSQPGPKPGTIIQTDETGKQSVVDLGTTGSPASGTSIAPDGTVVRAPVTSAGGRVSDRDYTPAELAEVRNQTLKSEEFKMASESVKAYEAMVANATQPGGMSAYAMRDTFARAINPGAVARSGTLQAIAEARGIPDSVKGFFLNLKGDGDLSDNTKQQIIEATLPFVNANYDAVDRLNKSGAAWAQRHGVDPADVTADLGDRPKPFTIKPADQKPPSQEQRLSPEDAAKLPPGTPFVGIDGQRRVRK